LIAQFQTLNAFQLVKTISLDFLAITTITKESEILKIIVDFDFLQQFLIFYFCLKIRVRVLSTLIFKQILFFLHFPATLLERAEFTELAAFKRLSMLFTIRILPNLMPF
jgi:hypothetical protein